MHKQGPNYAAVIRKNIQLTDNPFQSSNLKGQGPGDVFGVFNSFQHWS